MALARLEGQKVDCMRLRDELALRSQVILEADNRNVPHGGTHPNGKAERCVKERFHPQSVGVIQVRDQLKSLAFQVLGELNVKLVSLFGV